MYKLSFTLKQHTPIIHFQHEQEGATLRATEVKPKLDRFIIKKLKQEGKEVPKEWLVGNGEHPALNYKIRIVEKTSLSQRDITSLKKFEAIRERDGIPVKKMVWNNQRRIKEEKLDDYDKPIYERMDGLKSFFGNMDKETERKELKVCNTLQIEFVSVIPKIIAVINAIIKEFFFINNFGTRQSKGFGSFYLEGEANQIEQPSSLYFDIDINNPKDIYDEFKELFLDMNIFYSALRSGINKKKPIIDFVNGKKQNRLDSNGIKMFEDVYYFKSLLFCYAKNKLNKQWEKKSIKQSFYNRDKIVGNKVKYYGLDSQKNERNDIANDFPLQYEAIERVLIKDMFGLSSQEAWLSYDSDTIVKFEAINDGTPLDKENQKILRFKSPIQLKPIKIANLKYRVYIQIPEISCGINDQWFSIESKNNASTPIFLKTPTKEEFTVKKFFNYIFFEKNSKGCYCIDIDTHVQNTGNFHKETEHKILKSIFNSIREKFQKV